MACQNIIAVIAVLLLFVSSVEAGSGLAGLTQDFFPIIPWDGLRGWDAPVEGKNALESVAECNFTIAGFVQPKDLPMCEKLGLKAIMAPPPGGEPWQKKWLDVPDEQINESIKSWIEKSGKSSAIMGYFIVDEPGTTRFPALGKAVAAVGKYAPGKLAYINLYPGYATIGAPDQSQLGAASFTEYLEKYVAEVKPQMLSYDDYQVILSDNFQNTRLASIYFKDLMEVRRISEKYGIPFWNTICSNRIRPFTTVPSPSNLLLQAYTTLAAGGRGIAWYKYYESGYAYAPIDKNGNRTDTWFYLQMVNRQMKVLGPIMNRLDSTGVFFTNPAPAEGLTMLPGQLVEKVESRSSIKGYSDFQPPLMIGEFRGEDGKDYVMLVNLSLEKAANIIIHTRNSYSAKEVISAVNGSASPLDETNGHWLTPGQGVLIRLSNE